MRPIRFSSRNLLRIEHFDLLNPFLCMLGLLEAQYGPASFVMRMTLAPILDWRQLRVVEKVGAAAISLW
jgi:hypothetical protein